MEALYAILGFLFVTLGFATGYGVWERRTRQKSDGISPLPAIERQVEPPSASGAPGIVADGERAERTVHLLETDGAEEASIAAIAAEGPAPTQPPIPPEPEPSSERAFIPQPIIPDPWLSDQEPVVTESAIAPPVPGSTPPTVADPGLAVTDAVALQERITSLGHSGQLHHAATLVRYTNHASSGVRAAVATALGNMGIRRSGPSVESLIPVLGRLSQDTKSEVRVAAVAALGKIRSPKVLPWLQRSQQQSDPRVRKAATTALQNLKLVYQPKAKLKPEVRKKG